MNNKNNHRHSEKAINLLISAVPSMDIALSCAEVKKIFLKNLKSYEKIDQIYGIDSEGKYYGAISYKDVLQADEGMILKDLLPEKIRSVKSYVDQERVAFYAIKHHLMHVPVISKEEKFLGIVPAETIFSVLHAEGIEDILQFGGVIPYKPVTDFLNTSLLKSFVHRVPWLFLGLLGGVLAATIVIGFEATLSQNMILAAFIPLMAYMADAVGTQMEAFIIRDLALDPAMNFFRYFFRQLIVVAWIGCVISIAIYFVSLLLYQQPDVSLVVALALFCAIITSVFTGLIIPFVFNKCNLDPASASGPIATVIQDLLSVLVYFLIAVAIL